MKHIFLNGKGNKSVMIYKESPLPNLKKNEVLLQIKSTAVNRADILQRMGKYPAPQGHSEILGLEASGFVHGQNEKVMGLLSGGGYSQFAAIHKDHLMKVPQSISMEEAGGLPEVWLTAYLGLVQLAKIKKGQNVLIYAGASGVGSAAIQIAKHYECNVFVTCSEQEKIEFCQNLGATKAFNYKEQQEQEIIDEINQNHKGIDVILDCVGAQNFNLGLKVSNLDCQWILYGLLGGNMLEKLNLGILLSKRISLISTTLRDDDYKSKLISNFSKDILPLFDQGKFKVIIDQQLDVDFENPQLAEQQIQKSHEIIESNKNKGKVILNIK